MNYMKASDHIKNLEGQLVEHEKDLAQLNEKKRMILMMIA